MICYLCERKINLNTDKYVIYVVNRPTRVRTYQCFDCEVVYDLQ